MRILHVVASIDNEAAGPSVSVPHLAEAQVRLGAKVEIATVGDSAQNIFRTTVTHRRYRQSFPTIPLLRSLKLSSDLFRMLAQNPFPFDVVHSHGLWLAPNVYPATAARHGALWAVAPRGMLGPAALEFSAVKKKVFWATAQRPALLRAGLVHATSEEEAREARAAGIRAPVVVVPNGVSLPPLPAGPITTRRTILSLGRVHPKKGLDRLIDAWSEIAFNYPEWSVLIAGPDEGGHAEELRARARAKTCVRLRVEGPVFGAEKLRTYRDAGLFVLPTRHENFAMTVAEALAAKVPVISTRGAPWAGLEEHDCGLWVDHGPRNLARAMRQILDLPEVERAKMGERGREWMGRDFSWDSVAKRLLDAYEKAKAA